MHVSPPTRARRSSGSSCGAGSGSSACIGGLVLIVIRCRSLVMMTVVADLINQLIIG